MNYQVNAVAASSGGYDFSIIDSRNIPLVHSERGQGQRSAADCRPDRRNRDKDHASGKINESFRVCTHKSRSMSNGQLLTQHLELLNGLREGCP
jgi:hypothetical protein